MKQSVVAASKTGSVQSKNRSVSLMDQTNKSTTTTQKKSTKQPTAAITAENSNGKDKPSITQQSGATYAIHSSEQELNGAGPQNSEGENVSGLNTISSPASTLLPRKVSFSIDRKDSNPQAQTQQQQQQLQSTSAHACFHKDTCSKKKIPTSTKPIPLPKAGAPVKQAFPSTSQHNKPITEEDDFMSEPSGIQKNSPAGSEKDQNSIEGEKENESPRLIEMNNKSGTITPTNQVNLTGIAEKLIGINSAKNANAYSNNNNNNMGGSVQKKLRSTSTAGGKKGQMNNGSNCSSGANTGRSMEFKHCSSILSSNERKFEDMQLVMKQMRMEASQRLDRVELRQLQENVDLERTLEQYALEIKSQTKRIVLLTQEKDVLKEQADANENKVKQLLAKLKHFDAIRLELGEDLQTQLDLVSEAKQTSQAKAILYQELHSKHEVMKKQIEMQEKERAIHQAKIDKENLVIKEKLNAYDALNKQNYELTVDFERKNKEAQYQIKTLLDRLAEYTTKYQEANKNHGIFEKKFRAERTLKEQFQIELKLIQAAVHENPELKRKLYAAEAKLEEVEGVVDSLKRKIRANIDIDMKEERRNGRTQIERIIEKPIFIEKAIDVTSGNSQTERELAAQYKAQLDRCLGDLEELRRVRAKEQEEAHAKMLECETWKSHVNMLEDRYRCEFDALKANSDLTESNAAKLAIDKDAIIYKLNAKIEALLAQVETLAAENIDKNRRIADTLLRADTTAAITAARVAQNQQSAALMQTPIQLSATAANFSTAKKSAYIPYGKVYE